MNASITIDMGNAAFDDNHGGELARILRELADKVEGMPRGSLSDGPLRLHDMNGNSVGALTVHDDDVTPADQIADLLRRGAADRRDLIDLACDEFEATEATVDDGGNIHITGPGLGRFLDDDELEMLIEQV